MVQKVTTIIQSLVNVFTNQNEIAFTLVVKPGFNGTVTFSMDVVTNAGNLTNITNADLTRATEANPNYITADSTGPLLVLHGDSYVTLFTSQTYNDAGAYTEEYDDNYVPSITSNIGSIDFTIPGTYTITYSANADPFGNTAIDATRTVTVYAVNPIPINSLSIASSSGDNFANAGRTITVTLDAESNDLGNFTGTLLGKTLSSTTNGGNAEFTTTVLPGDDNGNVAFSITATNSTGSTLSITNSDITDSSFVTIDTVKPVIRLNGDSLIRIIQEATYSDQGATATDSNNSSYVGNVVTTFATPLNTSVLGNTIITYTADADAAGNVPDSKTRTVRVVTNDTIVDEKPSSSSRSSITLGLSPFGDLLVKEGFEYNGLAVNVTGYHTEFPLIDTHVGAINIVKIKIYDTVGPTGVQRLEFALSVPEIGLYHDSEVFIEVWMQRDNISVSEVVIVDPLNLLENSDVSVMASETSCTGDKTQCLLVEVQYSYREPPIYNAIAIKPVNWDDDARQFYFNDGIHVDGESENPQKEIDISPSHAINIAHTDVTLHLVQIDRAEHLWVDQYGHKWMIIGNNVRQITMDGHVVPDDNTYGILHGPDRRHPEFATVVYASQIKAQEMLPAVLRHSLSQ